MRISEGCLADVKEAVDILAVAGDFTALRRAGREYVGLCPYPEHPDKTPSFGVSPEKGFFLCRGCGQGGDAIKLVMDIRGVEFAEAVEHLAEQSGVEVEYEDSPTGAGGEARLRRERERAEQKEDLRALEAASAYYHAYLMRSPDDEARSAREYLKGRGMSPETLEAFNVGVAPSRGSGKGFCRKAKERHDLDGRALAAAGLVRGGEDYFAGRITFPVTDARGRTVGFGARALPGAPETYRTRDGRDVPNPKYINSPESSLYSKGRLLYGLGQSLPAMAKGRQAVVVEGYTDVLALHQARIPFAVATCGTATTPEHLRLLSRRADVVYLVFDPDAPGQEAVKKAREASELELDLRVLRLADDPADWLLEHSGGEFEGLLKDAPGVVEYEIDRRADAVRNAAPMTRQRALVDVQRLIGELSGRCSKTSTPAVPPTRFGCRWRTCSPASGTLAMPTVASLAKRGRHERAAVASFDRGARLPGRRDTCCRHAWPTPSTPGPCLPGERRWRA